MNMPNPGVVAPPLDAAAARLLDEALAELGHEENKCARFMAALTVASGAMITGFFAGRWSPVNLPAGAAIVWWFGAAGVALALGLVGWAAVLGDRPDARLPRPGPTVGADLNTLRYWAAALARHPDEDPAARLWRVRRTLGVKRRLLTAGLVAMASGVTLCVVGGLASV